MAPPPVVVGLDLSAHSLAALRWALRLAAGLHSRVVAVHAVGLLEEGGYRPHPDLDQAIAAVREEDAALAAVPVTVVREDGPPADVIVRVTAREGGELIVVGSRGLGAVERLLGSVSEGVLSRAEVPVVVVPPA